MEWLEVQAVTLDKTFVQQNSIITLQNDRQMLKEEISLLLLLFWAFLDDYWQSNNTHKNTK